MSRELYFSDFQVGQSFVSGRRTITETDLVLFSGFSGDYNPLHTDVIFANTTPFKQRIAHGMLVTSISVDSLLPACFILFQEKESVVK